jgi:hypothetical protein
MKKNMSTIDRIIRILIAIIFIILYFTNIISGSFGIILLIFSGAFILTSILGFCPVYFALGLSTIKKS